MVGSTASKASMTGTGSEWSAVSPDSRLHERQHGVDLGEEILFVSLNAAERIGLLRVERAVVAAHNSSVNPAIALSGVRSS